MGLITHQEFYRMQQEAALGRGDRVPNFRLPDQSGATHSFYHDVKGGAVLLLALGSLNSPQGAEAFLFQYLELG